MDSLPPLSIFRTYLRCPDSLRVTAYHSPENRGQRDAVIFPEQLAFRLGLISMVRDYFSGFSSVGNWGYTYAAHRKYGLLRQIGALDFLNERYARGEIARDEFSRMKVDIAETD